METHHGPIEHDAPYVNMVADPVRSIITIRWKNFAPSGTYRATLNMAVEWIEKHHLRYFLSDQRRRGPILHEDGIWLVNDLAPRLSRAGLERTAIVQSADFFNRTTVERIVHEVEHTIAFTIKNFKTMEEAEAWLTSREEVMA